MINSIALIEFVYLFAELSKRVLESARPKPTAVDWQFQGRVLRHQNRAIRLASGPIIERFRRDAKEVGKDELNFRTHPLDFSLAAGHVGYRIVKDIYVGFGFPVECIPYAEDVEGGEQGLAPQQWLR